MIRRKLLEVAPPSASRTKPAPGDTVWLLTLDQIESGSGRIEHRVFDLASEAGSSTFAFDKGNVLYSKLRPYLNKVICPDTNGIATTELVPLRPSPGELSREYLCLYLRSPEFVSWASRQVDGAKMPRMKMKSFWAYEIPVPPPEDQIRIAHLLGKVEGLIAQRKQQLQQLDQLLKSVFLEMFGDPVRNEKGWEKVPLETLGSLNRGVSKHRPRNAPELLGGKYPLIQTGEVSNAGTYITTFSHTYSDIGFAQSKLWPSGTLCITIAANIAQTAVLTFDACFPDSVVGFNAYENHGNVLYVHGLFWFFQKILEKNAPAAAQKNINLEILRCMEIPKPAIELQGQFAAIVERVEGVKSFYQQSLLDLEALYGALSQKAFKGELDLSRTEIPGSLPDESQRQEPFSVGQDTISSGFQLPKLPVEMSLSGSGRESSLRYWFDAALRDVSSREELEIGKLVDAINFQLVAMDDQESEFGGNDHDFLRKWIFEMLEEGRLVQSYNDAGNSIKLIAP